MKLLVIGRGYPEVNTGMVGIFEYEQAEAMINNYKEFDVMYFFNDNRSIKRLRQLKVIKKQKNKMNIFGLNFPIGGIPNNLFQYIKSKTSIIVLKQIIGRFGKPDVVHIHFPLITMTEDIWNYITSLNCKIIITEHYSRVQKKELSNKQRALLTKIAKSADEFLCVNEELSQSIKEITKVDRKYHVIPNIVSSAFTNISTVKDNNVDYRFISIGRLVKEKKFDILIKAFHQSFKDSVNIKLFIIGDGEEYYKLKRLVNQLGMQEKIILFGFQERNTTANLLSKSDVYVSASSFETFGVPTIEAMACGLPVIVADSSPLKSYINKERGMLFEVNNINSLSEKMLDIYNRKNIYKPDEISSFANEKFSETTVAKTLKYLYIN